MRTDQEKKNWTRKENDHGEVNGSGHAFPKHHYQVNGSGHGFPKHHY